MKQLQGLQGVYKASTMFVRHVKGIYNGCEACMRQLQEVHVRHV